MRPPHASFPFLRSSSLHPPLPESFPILPSACIFASPSSLFPTRTSLLSPFVCERDPTALATLSLGSPGAFVAVPAPGISEFPGVLGFDKFAAFHCSVLRCITLCRSCMHCLFFTLPSFTLLYFVSVGVFGSGLSGQGSRVRIRVVGLGCEV